MDVFFYKYIKINRVDWIKMLLFMKKCLKNENLCFRKRNRHWDKATVKMIFNFEIKKGKFSFQFIIMRKLNITCKF